MGERGPVPKRIDHRRRRNGSEIPVDTAAGAYAAMPDSDPNWHPIALVWYESLGESGQSEFYEQSDWAFAAFVAELTTIALTASRLNGQLITAVMAGMTELLTTEGARRRVRVELERETGEADPAHEHAVATITALRARG